MMKANRKSTYELTGLPTNFGVVLLTFGLILSVSPYMSGLDFGIFQVPQFDQGMRQTLKVVGPIVFASFIFLFVPIWKEGTKRLRAQEADDAIRCSSNQDSQSAGRHVDWTINVGDHIVSHREMAEGSYLESNHNRYKLVVQGDGNLVIYDESIPVWATGTDGKGVPPFKLVMQGDGNLVMYDGNGKPTWASNTNGKGRGPFRLTMQDDRNLAIYDSQGKSTWASNTSL